MRTCAAVLVIVLSVAMCPLIPAGCKPKSTGTAIDFVPPADYDRPLPPGKMGLAKVDPKDVPDFTAACGDLPGLRDAIDRSLSYLSKPSSRLAYAAYGAEFPHERAVASLRAFAEMIDAGLPPAQMNAALREKFDVYTSVGWNYKGEVLFTGYYTPIFDASPTRTERFQHPLYRQPPDLQKGPDGTTLTPYPARRELETTEKARLTGLELYWLADPFEVYVAHVQGSAKLRMPDGRLITVGYAANNGHEYRSVGKELLADGKIPQGALSLRAMIDYFKTHPEDVAPYTSRNPRFVFFTEQPGEPRGCLNEPVTAWRTVATDKAIFPRACLTFVAASLPHRSGNLIDNLPRTLFALDQDAGGAIRAPGRCDVYMGVGDDAGELAGRTLDKGRLYYLLLKDWAAPAAPLPAAPPPAVHPEY